MFSADRIETEQRFRRFNMPPVTGLFLLWGLGFLFMSIKGMTRDFTDWVFPVWEMDLPVAVFVSLFLLLWYGFVIFWICLVSRPLHTVHVSRDWVTFCIGPVVFRKLAVCDIATVVVTDAEYGWNNGRYIQTRSARIYLSLISAEELRERSMDRSTRKRKQHQDLRIGDSIRGRDSAVVQAMERGRMGRKWYLEWSESAEQALRENLTTSVFIK